MCILIYVAIPTIFGDTNTPTYEHTNFKPYIESHSYSNSQSHMVWIMSYHINQFSYLMSQMIFMIYTKYIILFISSPSSFPTIYPTSKPSSSQNPTTKPTSEPSSQNPTSSYQNPTTPITVTNTPSTTVPVPTTSFFFLVSQVNIWNFDFDWYKL